MIEGKRKSKNTFFTLILLLVQGAVVLALNPKTSIDKYLHHVWTARDGLPQNTIHAIAQDNGGFMWLGTDRGLVRFDGSVFKTFDKTNTPAIKNNSITSLLITGDGTLWIGTNGGGVTSYKNRRFKNYSIKDGLPSPFINAMTEDDRRNLRIATTGGGVIGFDGGRFTAVTDADGLSYNIVTSLFNDGRGKLWVGTEKGLNCLENGKITVYTKEDGLVGDNITAIFVDSKGYLWVGTANGISCIRNRPARLKKGEFLSLTTKDGLIDNFIASIGEDRDGNLWIATNGGLNRLRITGRFHGTQSPGRIKKKIESFTAGDGLSDNALLSLYEDRWGNLWVGTSGGGLNVFKEGKFIFYTVKDGLTGNYIKAIYGDDRGTLWIGTNGSGLNRLKNGKFDAFTQKDGLGSNYIESIGGDSEGNLWVGTPNGLNRFKNGRFKRFTTNHGLSNNSIKTLYADSRGNLWIGTFGGGLNRYKDGEFQVFNRANGLSDNFVLALEEDNYGNLWIGTNSGVDCFDGHLFRRFGEGAGVPRGMVLDIYSDFRGVTWIATHDQGLIRYKNGKFTQFKSGRGLSGNAIYRIIEDNRENLWLSSNGGIFSAAVRRLNIYADAGRNTDGRQRLVDWRHFREEDGLKTSVCTGGFQPAGWKTTDGMIWFPTIKGIAVIDLRKTVFAVKTQPAFPDMPEDIPAGFSYVTVIREGPVIIEKIAADGKIIKPRDHFKLPAGTEKIEFSFTAVGCRAPGKPLFKYRLWGYDRNWQMSRKNSALYRDVPAGKYRFKVFARNSDGNWTYEGDSYSFSIEYPFQKTFWFYVLVSVGLVLLVIGVPRLLEIRAGRKKIPWEKYSGSTLSAQKSRIYLNRLLKIMTGEKPYLDPDLSLQTLAQQMSITKEDLSQVINEQLNRNFKNFINEYRIEEAKKKLQDPRENQFVILKIAFDAGFNSKSVFNASFKKFTGLSPSAYRKKVQKKEK